jgi:hypothetical protein
VRAVCVCAGCVVLAGGDAGGARTRGLHPLAQWGAAAATWAVDAPAALIRSPARIVGGGGAGPSAGLDQPPPPPPPPTTTGAVRVTGDLYYAVLLCDRNIIP